MDTFGYIRKLTILSAASLAILSSIQVSSGSVESMHSEKSIAPDVKEAAILLEQDNAALPALEDTDDYRKDARDEADCRSIQCLLFAPESGVIFYH